MLRKDFEQLLAEDTFEPAELHSVTQCARCGCNNTCSCVIANGSCTTASGLGTALSPYKVEVVPDGITIKCVGGKLTSFVTVVPLDTDSIDMHVVEAPSGTFTISSDVFIQDDGTGPLAGRVNALKLNPGMGINGLYIDCEVIQDCIGEEIGPGLAGTCLVYDDTANEINVEIDPSVTNIIGCGTGPAGSGLFAAGSPTVINAIDNAQNIDAVVGPPDTITFTCVPVPISATTDSPGNGCLSVTGDTCNGFAVHLGLSNDACNTLQCRGNGLFAPFDPLPSPPDAAFNSAGGTFGPFNGNVDIILDGPHCFTWTNTDACRTAVLDFGTSLAIDQRLTGGNMRVLLEFNLNGGGFNSALQQFSSGPSNQGAAYLGNATIALVPPGGNFSACVRLRVVTSGAVNAFLSQVSFLGVLRYKLMGV